MGLFAPLCPVLPPYRVPTSHCKQTQEVGQEVELYIRMFAAVLLLVSLPSPILASLRFHVSVHAYPP